MLLVGRWLAARFFASDVYKREFRLSVRHPGVGVVGLYVWEGLSFFDEKNSILTGPTLMNHRYFAIPPAMFSIATVGRGMFRSK
jgi:hypothetical protein